MATFPLKPAIARSIGVTYKMVKLPVAAAPCVPDALKLVWFTDATGTFSETAEAAYLLPDPDLAAGPVLAVAGILGETCGAEIQWLTAWAPEGTGGEPGVFQDGNRLVVWPQAGSGPGLLTVRAFIAGKSYGPIVLTVLRYECAGYGYACAAGEFALDPLTWSNGETDIVEILGSGNMSYGHLSVVSGSWPVGTVFEWALDYGLVATITTRFNALLVSGNIDTGSGWLNASVTATTPDGKTETVGSITLTVVYGGC